MHIVVLSNDVITGFGVPVAAPGLRADGLAAGLREHGHQVTVLVPADVLDQLFDDGVPTAPAGSEVVAPLAIMERIDELSPDVVVCINSNLSPLLQPREQIRYVYDLFAPKVLELEASVTAHEPETMRAIVDLTETKTRALALADEVWVNGARKVDYANRWLGRAEVARVREQLGRATAIQPAVTVVEMPVALPAGIEPQSERPSTAGTLRLGIAGYAQQWSALTRVHPGHQRIVDAGHELHALLPTHWGGDPSTTPTSALPDATTHHVGPLRFDQFAEWVQSMDAMVDIFAPSPERRFAMITRSAVALRLGVPLIHAVDSEIADIVKAHNAGWVLDPSDHDAWSRVISDLANPEVVAAKRAGAREASGERFAPAAALRSASDALNAGAGSLPRRLDVLVPFWGLAGGVIKVLDYADHAAALGIDTTIWAPPQPTDEADPVSLLPVYQRLIANDRVSFGLLDELSLGDNPTVLFTEPTHHALIETAHPHPLGDRLIHLVQGTRHANPRWNDGLNYRLLHRPMTRLAVSTEVAKAIAPIVNSRHRLETIIEGHDIEYFGDRPAPARPERSTRLRVLYTTWKSDLGDRVAAALDDDEAFAFVAVRTPLAWPTLRNRYHGADVLLCTPGPEEGFYLPGLEAMAAGLAVVTAVVGGNAAYVRSNANALVVPYDDVDAHVEALRELQRNRERFNRLVDGGKATVPAHTLERERAQFGRTLTAIGT